MNKSNLTEEEDRRILKLEKIVKLNADDMSWSYNKSKDPKDKDIYDYQYEGISQLISRLDEYKVALLADEVGMGKTFQALSVMSYYFNKAINKDNFKVLVLSPNNIVMKQWRTEEYEKFYTYFLQEPKNIPIYNIEKKPQKNDRIIELPNFKYGFKSNVSHHIEINAQIIFAKTSSFQFGHGTDNDTEKKLILTEPQYKKRIDKCREDIKEFDLIIVDEAHQYRNYYRDEKCNSHRVTNAREIFDAFWERSDTKRDPKLLLLTATPLHSTNNDVKNILSVLYKNNLNENNIISQLLNKKEDSKSISKEIMNHIMIRRLKVMNGKTKYDYRQEKQLNVQLSDSEDVEVNVKNELFLALLQKKYIHSKSISNSKKNLSRSKNLLDILEGSDFGKITENKEKTDDDLKCIVSKYEKQYENLPTNNKYKDVLDSILPKKEYEDKSLDDKALVFVRRTASAYNLAREYIEIFDTKAWEKIKQSNNKISKKTPYPKDREEFSRLIEDKQKDVSRVRLVEDSKKDFVIAIFNDDEYKEYLLDRTIFNNSTIKGRVELLVKFYDNKDSIELVEYDLLNFVKKYKSKIDEMIAQNDVEKYWEQNKDIFKVKLKLSNVAEMLHEKIHKINIAQEYFNIEDEYSDRKFKSFIRMDINIVPKSYILDHFTKKKEQGKSNDAVKFHNRFTDKTSKFYNFFKDKIPKIIFPQLEEPEKYKILVDNNLLIKSAVLNGSIGLVELYCCYVETKEKTYDEFLKKVKEKVKSDDLIFIREIRYLINHFPTFQENGGYSFIKDTVDDKINKPNDEENQKIFYRSQPAYPYVGNTKNDTVISRFNSPFFPIMLCGTSTLQVGVNLHRFCSKVYHFGAAHTMGDDEQRIGRVDRIKGKLHRELEQDGSAKLDIYYPYLEKTFDEDNLKRMLCKKRSTEIEIDNCEITSDSLEVNCISSDSELKEIDMKYLLRPKLKKGVRQYSLSSQYVNMIIEN